MLILVNFTKKITLALVKFGGKFQKSGVRLVADDGERAFKALSQFVLKLENGQIGIGIEFISFDNNPDFYSII